MNRNKKIDSKTLETARTANQPNAKYRYSAKADSAALENDDIQSPLNQHQRSSDTAAG